MSPEPSTPIAEEMVRLHEIFVSMLEAGFTEDQSLGLLARLIRSSPSEK